MLKFMILLCFSLAQAKEFNEFELLKLAQESSSSLDQAQADLIENQLSRSLLMEKFGTEAFASSSYAETNERAIIQFQPIFTPIQQNQIGLKKQFGHGVSLSTSVGTDQRSTSSPFIGKIHQATTTTMQLGFQVDLWKDFLGALSKAEIKASELNDEKAKLESKIQEKNVLLRVRKLYWNLVANRESQKISEALLETAKKQSLETQRRFQNSIAEADELARSKAQISQREGNLIYLNYQRELLLKQLKNLIPSLSQEEIEITNYDVTRSIDQVKTCNTLIASQKKAPLDYTFYDDVIYFLEKIKVEKQKQNEAYSDVDVKLVGQVKATGVSSQQKGDKYYRGTYESSVNDIFDTNRTGYNVGLQVNIPIGDAKNNSEELKKKLTEKRIEAQIKNLDSQLVSHHQQIVKSILLLSQVSEAQKNTSEQLQKRLASVQSKYRQARAGITDLIIDQDALLQSELNSIDIKLQILNTLFDYLSIYTETPCEFNRI